MDRRAFCCICLTAFTSLLFFGCARHKPKIAYNDDISVIQSPRDGAPKAAVIYDSWSGNTQTVGEQFSRVLACEAMHVDAAADVDFQDHDLILIGSPVHGGMPTGAIDDFLSSLQSPAAAAVFVTYGAPLFGPSTANACLDRMAEKLDTACIGKFKCLGFHQIMRTYPTHPDEADKRDAARFAAGIRQRCRW